jgi:hypothetical protein
VRLTTPDGTQTTADVNDLPGPLGKGRYFVVWATAKPRFVELLDDHGYPVEVKSLRSS